MDTNKNESSLKDNNNSIDEKNNIEENELKTDRKWVEAQIPGFLQKKWPTDKLHVVDLGGRLRKQCTYKSCAMPVGTINPTIKIHNARFLEKEEGLTKAEFFERHGFVLLDHVTKMKEGYWKNQEEIRDIYNKELEPIIRETLFPKSKIKDIPFEEYVFRRGPGTANPFYGLGVHGDSGFGPDHWEANAEFFCGKNYSTKWRTEYEKKDTAGFICINFWRPVLPMKGPVKKIPLAVCDISTVDKEDIVRKHLYGFIPGKKDPVWNSSLKFNENQRWCYYPNMTVNEILVFKQFVCMKDDPDGYRMQCLHSAFKDPTTPLNSELRHSSEYRVPIWFEK